MPTVTERIQEINQPYGGILPLYLFESIQFEDNLYISDLNENIHSSRIGTTVDYLTRFMLTGDLKTSFQISLLGASIANQAETAEKLLKKIKGLDDKSIQAACSLTGYDVFYRDFIYTLTTPNYSQLFLKEKINTTTKRNIRTMVERSLSLFDTYGPVLMTGFTFDNGYSETITAADADFLTEKALFDFKTTKKKHPSSKDTLQLLIYYVMGCKSIHSELFKKLPYIAIFNPRYNQIFRLPTQLISKETIQEVENNIICYGKTRNEVMRDNHYKQRQKIKDGKMLDSRETCEFLMIPMRCLSALNSSGKLHPIKQGAKNYYKAEELKEYYLNNICRKNIKRNNS